jgi:hypothetical protein
VWDLGLIILDECCNTFFDRVKTQDRQPQVMDIFAEAIGNVTNKHTMSSHHLWHWTEKASVIYRSNSKINSGLTSDLHVPLLDINSEGRLQREVKDIIDELEIMIKISKRQHALVRRYSKHAVKIMDPTGKLRMSNGEGEDVMSRNTSWFFSPNGGPTENRTPMEDLTEEQKEKKKKLDWFMTQATDVLDECDARVNELEGLRTSARSTAENVKVGIVCLKKYHGSGRVRD